MQLRQGLTHRNPEVDDDVALQSIEPWLAMIDILNLLAGNMKVLKNIVVYLSETPVAQTIDGNLNCGRHLQIGP